MRPVVLQREQVRLVPLELELDLRQRRAPDRPVMLGSGQRQVTDFGGGPLVVSGTGDVIRCSILL